MEFSLGNLYSQIADINHANIGFLNFIRELPKLMTKLPNDEYSYLTDKIHETDDSLKKTINIPKDEVKTMKRITHNLSDIVISEYGITTPMEDESLQK